MLLDVRADPAGVTFRVKVQPGAGRTGVAGEWEGALKIKVGKKPEHGAANREALAFLADLLGVPRRAVSLVQGERSHLKTVHVNGLTAAAARERLQDYRV
jgi:uncharacterized protein